MDNKKKLILPSFLLKKNDVFDDRRSLNLNEGEKIHNLLNILNEDMTNRSKQMKEQTEYYARNNKALKIKTVALSITTLVTILGVTIGSMQSLLSFDSLAQNVKKALELYIKQMADLKTQLESKLDQNFESIKKQIQKIGDDFETKFSDIKIENKEILDSYKQVKVNIEKISSAVEGLNQTVKSTNIELKELATDLNGFIKFKKNIEAFFTLSNDKGLTIKEGDGHLQYIPEYLQDSRLKVKDDFIEEKIPSQTRSKRQLSWLPAQAFYNIYHTKSVEAKSVEFEKLDDFSTDDNISSKIMSSCETIPIKLGLKNTSDRDTYKITECHSQKTLLDKKLFKVQMTEKITQDFATNKQKKESLEFTYFDENEKDLKVRHEIIGLSKEDFLFIYHIDLKGKTISHIPYEKIIPLHSVYIGSDAPVYLQKTYWASGPLELSFTTRTVLLQDHEIQASDLVYMKKYSKDNINFIDLISYEIQESTNKERELHESLLTIPYNKNITVVDKISNEEETKVFSQWVEFIKSIDDLKESEIHGEPFDQNIWTKIINFFSQKTEDQIRELKSADSLKNIDLELLAVMKKCFMLKLCDDYDNFIYKNQKFFINNEMLLNRVNFYQDKCNKINASILDQFSNFNNTATAETNSESLLELDHFLESDISLEFKEKDFDANILDVMKSKDNMTKFGYVSASMSFLLSILRFHTVIFDYRDRRHDKKKTSKPELIRSQIRFCAVSFFGIMSLFLTGGASIPIVAPSMIFASCGLLIDWRQRLHYAKVHYTGSKMLKILNHSEEMFQNLKTMNEFDDSTVKVFERQFNCLTDNIFKKLSTIGERKVTKNEKKILAKKHNKIQKEEKMHEIFKELNKLSILCVSLKVQINEIKRTESNDTLKALESINNNIVKIILNAGCYERVIDDIFFIKEHSEKIEFYLNKCESGDNSFLTIKEEFSHFIDLKSKVEKTNQKEKNNYFRSIRLVKCLRKLQYTEEKKKLQKEQEDLQKNVLGEVPKIISLYERLSKSLYNIQEVSKILSENEHNIQEELKPDQSADLQSAFTESKDLEDYCKKRIDFYVGYP